MTPWSVPYGGVGAAPSLHGADAARLERLVSHQKLAVLAREDVVRYRRDVVRLPTRRDDTERTDVNRLLSM